MDGTRVGVRFEYGNETSLYILHGTEFEPGHAADDVNVDVIGTEWVAVHEVRVRCAGEGAGHPRVCEDFREGGADSGVSYEHA